MTGPLEGIKVLDVSGGAAGPIAGALLGELGADVIKVEAPWGDFVRNRSPYKNGVDIMVTAYSRSKRSIVLDLKTEKDRSLMMTLVKWADIFLENFKGGVTDRMGLGYKDLSSINPSLIYASSGSYGSKGPLRSKATMGSTSPMFAGWGSISGPPGGAGVLVGAVIGADPVSPTYLVMDILMALYYRELTGVGQKIETAQILTSIALQQATAQDYFITGKHPDLMGSASRYIVPSQVFATKDADLAVEAPTEKTWKRLCKALSLPELVGDPKFATNALRVQHRGELVPRLEAVFKERETADWLVILREQGVPCETIARSIDDFYADPQVKANKLVIEMHHSKAGWLKTSAVPWQFSETPVTVKSLGPMLGEHSKEIRQEFGFPEEDEQALAAAKGDRLAGR